MKQRIIYALLIVGLSFIIYSCVDVNNSDLPKGVNYTTIARFVNVAGDTPASTALTVDGSSVGSIAFGNASGTGYATLQAGNRTLGFGGASQIINFSTDEQYTVLAHSLDGTDRFLKLDDGYDYKNNSEGKTDTAQVRFVNVAKGFNAAISFRVGSSTGTEITSGAYLKDAVHVDVSAAAHTYYAVSNGGYKASLDGTQDGVTTSSSGTATVGLSEDNGVTFSIKVKTSPLDGFYNGSHFHQGAVGVNGPVVFSFTDTTLKYQSFTFGSDTLKGSVEVPSSNSTASGVGTFTLYNDPAGGYELDYTIVLHPDTSDPFIAGHFHSGAAGTAGPIVKTIATGPIATDSTITDEWKTSDVQSLTAALVDSLLHGKIYVNFHTAAHPAGAIRAQLIPDSLSVNTFSGTWNDSTLTPALKQAFVSGNIYANFHTAAHAGGLIRGQVTVDATVGNYAITSITTPALSAGKLYTIVAADSGSTLKFIQLSSDRQGASKVSVRKNK